MTYLVSYQRLREQIRQQKNSGIQAYFRRRIYGTESPYHIWGRSQPMRILLILSHMRSGSSLLTHLLNQNSEILGYGETHITYQTATDFKQLMAKVYWQCHEFRKLSDLQNLRINHQYVLDKVLHNNLLSDCSILTHPQVYVIFLIREPIPSLMSLKKLKPHLNDYEQFGYYKNRLIQLGNYAELINNKEQSLWLTYDQILNQTQAVLTGFKDFLGTESEFSEQYQILKTTGRKGVGDSQSKIKSGKIIRSQSLPVASFPEEITQEAEEVYRKTYQRLLSHCTSAVPNE